MKLVLIRHAEAEPVRLADSERALTGRGQIQAGEAGAWLASVLDGPVVLACSPYRRARETAARIQLTLPDALLQVEDSLSPEHDVRQAMQAIDGLVASGTLVVVSHMPLIAGLAGWLSDGVMSGGQPFGLAEARVFELELPGAAQARLVKRFLPGT